MGRPEDAVKLLKKGYSPNQIAKEWDRNFDTVKGYLYRAVGKGDIQKSDIFFSIDQETRDIIESIIKEINSKWYNDIYRTAEEQGMELKIKEIILYLELRNAVLGDMYEFIYDIETTIHKSIKNILTNEYGQDEIQWWKEGIPKNIRQRCASNRENDLEHESYCYTTFGQLKEILQYKLKDVHLKYLPENVLNSDDFFDDMTRLNNIRNSVMHPVRRDKLTKDDFDFAQVNLEGLPLKTDSKWYKRLIE